VFDLAALVRLAMVVMLCGYVIRDIVRPGQDVVRTSYDGGDPDGGVFNDPGGQESTSWSASRDEALEALVS